MFCREYNKKVVSTMFLVVTVGPKPSPLSDTSVASFGSATNTFLLQLVAVCQKELCLLRDSQRLAETDASEGERTLGERFNRGVGLRRYHCPLCGLTFALRFRCLRGRVLFRLHEGGFTTLSRHHRPQLDFEVVIFCVDGECFVRQFASGWRQAVKYIRARSCSECPSELKTRQTEVRESAVPAAAAVHQKKEQQEVDFSPPFECPFCSASAPPALTATASASRRGILVTPSSLQHPHNDDHDGGSQLESLHLTAVPSFLRDIQDEIQVSSSASPPIVESRPSHTSVSTNPFDADVDA
ncbi:unnamed protein product [Dibothriocephalus latus]|uniref:Uncharacterized protein n=1 Tax=Dibothriocephalus latus TaxID=60516 RepID=A0A3P7LWK9_DIBLA|nr:unnamed protein product [Dibothriocephalus latus]